MWSSNNKKIIEKASEEQRNALIKDTRKIWSCSIGIFESFALMRYIGDIGIVLVVVILILFGIFAVPAAIENSKILKELK